MKVLVITNMYPSKKYPYYGSFVHEMVKALAEYEGVSCEVISISDRRKGIFRNVLKYLNLLLQSMKAALFSHYDVVNVHYIMPTGLVALPAFLLRRKPLVLTAHGSDVKLAGKNPILRVITTFLLQRAARIVAVSEFLSLEIQKEFSLDANKIEVINCGVDTALFVPKDKAAAKNSLGLSPAEKIILFVGNLTPLKGLRPLLQAFQKIAAQIPGTNLVIIGEGPLQAEILAAAAKGQISTRVRLVGPMAHEQIPLWMACADVFVLPSFREGFGLVALEAMACGAPVVVSRVGGMPEYIESGKDGFLVEPGDVEGLIEKINLLLHHEQLRSEVGAAARRKSLAHDIRKQVKRLHDIFSQVSGVKK